jgi:D-alanine-D-alanine ligase
MKRTIGVLAGGDSPERDVSLLSGRGVLQALEHRKHDARFIEIDTLDDLVRKLEAIDVVFNCLHGGSGEDGTVRLLLDVMKIPTIGSGPLACARAMNKAQAKAIFRSAGIPTPEGIEADANALPDVVDRVVDSVGFPMILKPRDGGSTLFVYRIDASDQLLPQAKIVLANCESVLFERFITGRELTVGILTLDGQDTALPVIEIRCAGDLFDYHAKYTAGEAEFLVPPPLPTDVAAHVQDLALRAHHALGCTGFSRVDIRLGDDGVPYVLEVNTLPGMTTMSDLPRAAAAAGIGYEDLVERMLETATVSHSCTDSSEACDSQEEA